MAGEQGKESGPPQSDADAEARAKAAFQRGILERGEAAVADANGNLPPGATHEIVGTDADGRPILKRRRYSLV